MVMYRVQMTLKTDDLNPANFATNTWYVLGVDVADAESFKDTLVTEYSTLTTYLSNLLLQSGHEFKIYDMEDPEPRAPVSEGTWALSANPTAAPLPPEVALCLSFQAPKLSGFPQSRRRGRVYIGPLSVNALDSSGRPSSAFVTALSGVGDGIIVASGATSWNWAVHSSFSETTGLPVDNGWVDNEFDTQRRRGREWTSRTVFPP